MSFNPDPKKPAQELLFSKKNSNITHPIIYFINFQVQRANQQKAFRVILDEKLNFKCHIDKGLTKTSKSVAVIKRLRSFLPRKSLITIYKAIIRAPVDHGDILNEQPNNTTFYQKIESVQYKTALTITGAIQNTSQEKNLYELGIETLETRKWLRRLCYMYKIMNIGIPKYLTDLIAKREIGCNIRNRNKPFSNCRTKSFKNSFFSYTIEAWYSLDPTIINSKSIEVFKNKLLVFMRPVQRSIYCV